MWGEETGSEFSLPSSALPGSTRAAAEPGKGPAASGQRRAGGKGRRGLTGIPAPAVPVFLLHLLFSLSGPWWGTGSQGWAEPHRCQEGGSLAPAAFQRHRDKGCTVIAHSGAGDGVLQGGSWQRSCSNLGTVVVMLLCFPKPVKEEKEESFVLVEINLDTVPSNSHSTELRMSNPKRALETPLH